MIDWVELLREGMVNIEKGRHIPKVKALINVTTRDEYIQMDEKKTENSKLYGNDEAKPTVRHFVHPDRREALHLAKNEDIETQFGNNNSVDSTYKPCRYDNDEYPQNKIDKDRFGEAKLPEWIVGGTKEGGKPPPDEPPDSSDEEDPEKQRRTSKHKGGLRDGTSAHGHYNKGLGMNGLIRAFVGKPTFSGAYDEELEGIISVFETLARMCDISEDEKLRSIPIMLSGEALNHFALNIKGDDDYKDALKMMRSWYNNEEKKSRVLAKWQSMKLSEAFAEDPTNSEAAIFRTFVSKIIRLQNQLDASYQADNFL